jgi:hypothetical protein
VYALDKDKLEEGKERSSVKETTRNSSFRMISFMKNYLPNYFGSEWSFAQYKYSDLKHGITHCTFTKEGDIALMSEEGKYEYVRLDYQSNLLERENLIINLYSYSRSFCVIFYKAELKLIKIDSQKKDFSLK